MYKDSKEIISLMIKLSAPTFLILVVGVLFGSLWNTDNVHAQIAVVLVTFFGVGLGIGFQVTIQRNMMKDQFSKVEERLTKMEKQLNSKSDSQ